MTVLVIDDAPDILLIVQKALELDGMDVLTATTALEGIRRAGDERPDGIVMDLMLPDLPGTVLLERLQAGEATRDIPVVVLTARTRPEEIEDVLARGARDVIGKPFEPDRLGPRLRELFTRS
jgi:two-component system phosphate regulon response regulator PhoB